MKKEIYVAIDLGSATIKLVVGEVLNNSLNIFAVKKIRTSQDGFKGGQLIGKMEVADNIKKAVTELEKELNLKINQVILSIPPLNMQTFITQGKVVILNEHKQIGQNEIQSALNNGQSKIDNQFQIVQSVQLEYEIIKNNLSLIYPKPPLNQLGDSLKIKSAIHTIPKTLYTKYLKTIESTGLKLHKIILSPEAISGDINLKSSKKAHLLIDLGHHTTTVSFFKNNILDFAKIINIGGKHIAQDIKIIFNTKNQFQEANALKHNHCRILQDNDNPVYETVINEKKKIFTYKDLNNVVKARLNELLEKINNIIEENNINNFEIILSGGSSNLVGIDQYFGNKLNYKTIVYVPRTIGAKDQSLAAVLGIIYLESQKSKVKSQINLNDPQVKNYNNWIKNFWSKLHPTLKLSKH